MRLLLALFLVAGCQSGFDAARDLPPLDEAYFRCKVQPILTKTCGTFACHGDARRFFRLYGRNRLRLGGSEVNRNSQLSGAERAANYDSARAFVDGKNLAQSLLLQKPLEMAAGGYYHRGALIYDGGNVFQTKSDPEYQILVAWAGGKTADPACLEPGSDL